MILSASQIPVYLLMMQMEKMLGLDENGDAAMCFLTLNQPVHRINCHACNMFHSPETRITKLMAFWNDNSLAIAVCQETTLNYAMVSKGSLKIGWEQYDCIVTFIVNSINMDLIINRVTSCTSTWNLFSVSVLTQLTQASNTSLACKHAVRCENI